MARLRPRPGGRPAQLADAVIHVGTCSHCNNGNGVQRNPLGNKNGRWLSPFDTLIAAEEAARATRRQVQKRHSCV